ncbi:MAG TPA: trypsin-like peptidase domain-containing protein [Thermoanaerobaculia bacterium]|nr:trypsin-like peptidase domain-containing protein [Thermoanaerobaculia bacterium]
MKNLRLFPHVFVLAITLLVACGAGPEAAPQERAAEQEVREQLGAPAEADLAAANALSSTFRAAAQRALPAVVYVEVERQASGPEMRIPEQLRPFFGPQVPQGEVPMVGSGSGFILDAAGHVVTNHHVVEGAEQVLVRLVNGREYMAEVVGSDASTDVAVLRLLETDGADLPRADLGSSDALRVGDWVLALGSPLGLDFTVTAGIVSAKGRQISGRQAALEAFIQTDAAINQGNSGGPLVDLAGRVVGINTAIVGGMGFVGYGFAIPIDLAQRAVRDLLEVGYVRRPQLGVSVQDVTAVDAEVYRLPRVAGAEISFVQRDTPAARAELAPGDVIVAVDDDEVANATDLTTMLARRDPGDEVTLTYFRDGERQTTRVELGQFERPESAAAAAEDRRTPERVLGFSVQPLAPQTARQLGYETAEGVVIADVSRLGAAARAGLRPGMRLLAINGQPVSSVTDVAAAARGIESGDVVSLRVEVPELGETVLNFRARN